MVSLHCNSLKNRASSMQIQLDEQSLKGGSHKCFIVLWEWMEKGTIKLTHREQMPSDAGGGLVGLGAGQGCTLLWCLMFVI